MPQPKSARSQRQKRTGDPDWLYAEFEREESRRQVTKSRLKVVALLFACALTAVAWKWLPSSTSPSVRSEPPVETAKPVVRPTNPATGKEYTPEEIDAAKLVMESLGNRALVEDEGVTLYVTFNEAIETDRIFKATEIVVIADQVLGHTRYVHFYDPARHEIATFSPLTGLKVLRP